MNSDIRKSNRHGLEGSELETLTVMINSISDYEKILDLTHTHSEYNTKYSDLSEKLMLKYECFIDKKIVKVEDNLYMLVIVSRTGNTRGDNLIALQIIDRYLNSNF